jgi:hypothetical protein
MIWKELDSLSPKQNMLRWKIRNEKTLSKAMTQLHATIANISAVLSFAWKKLLESSPWGVPKATLTICGTIFASERRQWDQIYYLDTWAAEWTPGKAYVKQFVAMWNCGVAHQHSSGGVSAAQSVIKMQEISTVSVWRIGFWVICLPKRAATLTAKKTPSSGIMSSSYCDVSFASNESIIFLIMNEVN